MSFRSQIAAGGSSLHLLISLSGALVSGGCAVGAYATHEKVDVAARARAAERIYERALRHFDRAAFWKPRTESVAPLVAELAPLIVQEVTSESGEPRDSDRFGALSGAASDPLTVEPGRPTVYYEESRTTVGGTERKQIAYVWFYEMRPPNATDQSAIAVTGIRGTLGEDLFPLVWEVEEAPRHRNLDEHGFRLLFVADSVEARAIDAFGQALPGRRHVVERCIEESPDTIVARILEDGPVPMGPFVYRGGSPAAVTTLLCRCSPSQVQEIVETAYYELRPLEELGPLFGRLNHQVPTWRHDCFSHSAAQRLPWETVLRWPDGAFEE